MTDPMNDALQDMSQRVADANTRARAIVGPERRTIPAVLDAANRLYSAGRIDDVRPCQHFDPAEVAWWSPDAPGVIACRSCHEEASAARGDRCDLCRRTDGPLVHVLHLVAAPPPAVVGEGQISAMSPVVVDVLLCGPCGGDGPARPERKKKRR